MAKKRDTKPPKAGKRGKARRRSVNPFARLLGTIAGLSMLAYASFGLVFAGMDLLSAGKLALIALVLAVVVEKVVVPFGSSLIGPPRALEQPAPAAPKGRRERGV